MSTESEAMAWREGDVVTDEVLGRMVRGRHYWSARGHDDRCTDDQIDRWIVAGEAHALIEHGREVTRDH